MEDNGAILRTRPRGENKESYIYGWRMNLPNSWQPWRLCGHTWRLELEVELYFGVLPGGGATFDVSSLALMHFYSLLRRKVAMTPMTVETIATPISFVMSYKSELLLMEPRGGGTAKDGVGFPMATRPSILYRKIWRW